jgi:hypothetical protein
MSILGGSPLGLIGVKSTPTKDGMSTFNGGKSRNINVNFYNTGRESDTEKMDKSNNKSGGMFSVFTGGNVIRPWANIGGVGKETPTMGLKGDYKRMNRRTLHNNDVYDTSILNIVEKTANTSAALRPSDFAYLKNLGVYPNNRLVIARRFAGPMPDDIFAKGSQPLSVMITWKPEGDDFLDISFGEFWEEAKADFTSVLNDITKDIVGKAGGDQSAKLLSAIPLPGFTEPIQRSILKKFGVLDENSPAGSPTGDPNLIKEAKRRKTVGYGQAGSGLMCKVSIKMIVEYEQKFISGIDPTVVFMDILANAVRFGTTDKVKFGLSNDAAKLITGAVNDPGKFVIETVDAIKGAIDDAVKDIKVFISGIIKAPKAPDPAKAAQAVSGSLTKILTEIKNALSLTIQKYRLEIEGIVRALALLPSTPWHVTIGNPLRPIFCSGDMYTTDINLKLGPTLAFNDLPSYITIDFTLTNARNWGADDIMSKFNTGYLRTVNFKKDVNSVSLGETINDRNYQEPSKVSGTNSNVPINNSTSNVDNQVSGSTQPNQSETQSTTRENDNQPSVNSNPNSPSGATT